MDSTTSPHVEIQLSNIPSEKNRELYRQICVPLYNLALEGNWKEASRVLQEYPKLLMAAITNGWKTILHVAAGTDHVPFIEELVKLMRKDELELQDYNRNTALFSAATTGNLQIAELLISKNESLPTVRGKESVFPVQLAALQGQSEMAWYLYEKTFPMFEDVDWNKFFLACIKNGIYGKNTTYCFEYSSAIDKYFSLHNQIVKLIISGATQTIVLELVGHLWDVILCDTESEDEIRSIIRDPLFDAAKVRNSEFLAQLMSTYHQADLMWEIDEEDRSIIHFAVLHCHAKIFNLIHKIGAIKDVLVTFENAEGNNLLHCAAKLAPSEQLNSISGAAFQMMHELMWFEVPSHPSL
ncbi:hypothetical protein L6164_016761 [Bauhinia variegata]|uniref:Uncharacterized protein n=1 Tax=Bauhinia variegata TaxID=167791 RepID=A0ACB9N659_BAUVA|nr:hypothetical protein L6164_016761 [Bauhinia variegata]